MIEEEVQARERSSARSTHEGRRPKECPTAAALFTDTPSPQCCFCQQGYSSQDCRAITGVESRREVLRKVGRCYSCLGRGHVSRNCHSRIMCIRCKGRHHVAICPNESKPKPRESHTGSSSDTTANLNPEATPYSPPSTSTLWTYSGKHVLLQTAQATAFNPDHPSKACRVRIVMAANDFNA